VDSGFRLLGFMCSGAVPLAASAHPTSSSTAVSRKSKARQAAERDRGLLRGGAGTLVEVRRVRELALRIDRRA
jgi:hypothetical protein